MSETELSEFVKRERSFIEIRSKLPFENIVAPESEYQLFQARMKALDGLETLYQEIERELASTRSTLELIEKSVFKATEDEAVGEPPARDEAIEPAEAQRQLKAA